MLHRSADTGIKALVGQLVVDARALAVAEVDVVKARAGEAVGRYRSAAVFFAAAGVVALAGFIALLVGLILWLATLVGPGFATAIVVGVVMVIAVVLGLVGKSKLAPRSDAHD